MTVKEIIDGLKFTIDMFLFEPSTGETFTEPRNDMDKTTIDACKGAIELLEQTRWIPVKWHEITDEEREREGYPKDWVCHLDCILPEDGEEILITTKNGYVEKDTAYCDDGYYLDSGYDWVDDVVAWMPLPEPYRESEVQDADSN
jgi:hypothetical protein